MPKNDATIQITNKKLHVHSWGSWTTTKEPTCTEKGVKERTCQSCGNVERDEIAAKGHSLTTEVTKQPTCTETGTKTSKCSVCDYETSEVVNALGHNFTNWRTTSNPNCTKEGSKEASCSRCNEKKTESIPATGHHYAWVVTKEATESSNGIRQHKCSVCGNVDETEIIPKKSSSNPTPTPTNPTDPSTPSNPGNENTGGENGEQGSNGEGSGAVEEIDLDEKFNLLKEAALEQIDEAYDKLDKNLYSRKNWKLINEIYEEAKFQIDNVDKDKEPLLFELANEYTAKLNEVEPKPVVEGSFEFDKGDAVVLAAGAVFIALSLFMAKTITKQKQEVLAIMKEERKIKKVNKYG